MGRKQIAVDFDDTIYDLKSNGWNGGRIVGPPMDGTKEAFEYLFKSYNIVIFTARITMSSGGINKIQVYQIRNWLKKYDLNQYVVDITNIKNSWMVAFIDNRSIHFGDWKTVIKLLPKVV